jgi:hypothetical protein
MSNTRIGGTRPGAGRPRKYGRATLRPLTNLQSTIDQAERWKKAAKAVGLELQDWIRQTLDKGAQ